MAELKKFSMEDMIGKETMAMLTKMMNGALKKTTKRL